MAEWKGGTLDIAKELAENNFKSVIISSGEKWQKNTNIRALITIKLKLNQRDF